MKSVMDFDETAVSLFIEKVMKRAALTFSSLCSREIIAQSVNVALVEGDCNLTGLHQKTEGVSVLITPLLGELPGKSYLILNSGEIETLLTSSPLKPANGFDEVLKEALLKEIDNILSACVITDLANHFSIDVYGDVPQLLQVQKGEVDELVDKYIPNGQLSLVCHGRFAMKDNTQFSPHFVWKFSSAIVEKIQMISKT